MISGYTAFVWPLNDHKGHDYLVGTKIWGLGLVLIFWTCAVIGSQNSLCIPLEKKNGLERDLLIKGILAYGDIKNWQWVIPSLLHKSSQMEKSLDFVYFYWLKFNWCSYRLVEYQKAKIADQQQCKIRFKTFIRLETLILSSCYKMGFHFYKRWYIAYHYFAVSNRLFQILISYQPSE